MANSTENSKVFQPLADEAELKIIDTPTYGEVLEWKDSDLKHFPIPEVTFRPVSAKSITKFVQTLHDHKDEADTALMLNDMIMAFGLQLLVDNKGTLIYQEYQKYLSDATINPDQYHVHPDVLAFEDLPEEAPMVSSNPSAEQEQEHLAMEEYKARCRAALTEMKSIFPTSAINEKLSAFLESEDNLRRFKANLGAWCIAHVKCIVKSETNIVKFFSTKLSAILNGIYGYDVITPYMPALSETVYQKMHNALKRCQNDAHAVLIRTTLAIREISEEKNLAARDLLHGLVTMQTSEHAITCLIWATKASSALDGVSFAELVDQLRVFSQTEKICQKLFGFHIKYRLTPEAYSNLKQNTRDAYKKVNSHYYHIARILNNSYFRDLGRKGNHVFMAACYTIVETVEGGENLANFTIEKDSMAFDIGKAIADAYLEEYYKRMSTNLKTSSMLQNLNLEHVYTQHKSAKVKSSPHTKITIVEPVSEQPKASNTLKDSLLNLEI